MVLWSPSLYLQKNILPCIIIHGFWYEVQEADDICEYISCANVCMYVCMYVCMHACTCKLESLDCIGSLTQLYA